MYPTNKINLSNVRDDSSDFSEIKSSIFKFYAEDINGKSIPFEITYKIRGLNSIYVGLGGKKNEIFINGNWKNPSFKGDFLPIERKVSSEEFSANYEIWKVSRKNESW